MLTATASNTVSRSGPNIRQISNQIRSERSSISTALANALEATQDQIDALTAATKNQTVQLYGKVEASQMELGTGLTPDGKSVAIDFNGVKVVMTPDGKISLNGLGIGDQLQFPSDQFAVLTVGGQKFMCVQAIAAEIVVGLEGVFGNLWTANAYIKNLKGWDEEPISVGSGVVFTGSGTQTVTIDDTGIFVINGSIGARDSGGIYAVSLDGNGFHIWDRGDGVAELLSDGVYFNEVKVVGGRGLAIAAPTGGTTIDAEARTAIGTIISRLEEHGLIGTSGGGGGGI